jgi:hypothetical protein
MSDEAGGEKATRTGQIHIPHEHGEQSRADENRRRGWREGEKKEKRNKTVIN